jgi:hypothetical protein
MHICFRRDNFATGESKLMMQPRLSEPQNTALWIAGYDVKISLKLRATAEKSLEENLVVFSLYKQCRAHVLILFESTSAPFFLNCFVDIL